MTPKSTKGDLNDNKIEENTLKTCFVIMPIADHPDYPPGHFDRVYEYIIKPACEKAGFVADRADDAKHTHVIMLNILQRILNADMAICDLSSRNPNVLYELGIRQAFDRPVTLIKDDKTTRIFDTGMISDAEYISDLRIDNVQIAVEAIATRLQNTYEKKDEEINSLIQIMKIEPAKSPSPTVVSSDTNVVLEAIAMLGRRISALESPKGLAGRARQDLDEKIMFLRSKRQSLHVKAAYNQAQIGELKAKVLSMENGPERDAAEKSLADSEALGQRLRSELVIVDAQISHAEGINT